MIKDIDIKKFGCFANFKWSSQIRDEGSNQAKFKKLNIIFGRNYSGKTTLSRIIRSLETGILPGRYAAPEFQVTHSSGTVTHTQIPLKAHEIRVYNKDFVDEHLSFLRAEDGHIASFAVLGSKNAEIEAEIARIEEQIGSVEKESGLRFAYHVAREDYKKKEGLARDAAANLEKKLTDKANKSPGGIKHNPIYRDANYDIRKLRSDIAEIAKSNPVILSDADRSAKITLLGETPLPSIDFKRAFQPAIGQLQTIVNATLTKKIKPSLAIQELLNDAVLQNWVKSGIELHKDKRSTCGFCGSLLPVALWRKLGDHFNKESEELDRNIAALLARLSQEKTNLKAIPKVDRKAFYSSLLPEYEERLARLEQQAREYENMLTKLEDVLKVRKENIFAELPPIAITDNSQKLQECIASLGEIVNLNNKSTESLARNQADARRLLRLHEISRFLADIDYEAEQKNIKDISAEVNKSRERMGLLENDGTALNKRIEGLKLQLRDERRGAEKVNQYLGHYFSHGGLRLVAQEDPSTTAYRFKIVRGAEDAYNLSEGECSLISFCYFMAKLNDIESSGKTLIVYIDDPISSLDSNHIFFVFSLINALLIKPMKSTNAGDADASPSQEKKTHFEQVFISTHNLEFLKYLKRLEMAGKDTEYFSVLRTEGGTQLSLMPGHFRKYITELNFLFGEIYFCSNSDNSAKHYQSFYNFGNNLRKFLEAFLFFKYPNATNGSNDKRIEKFFGDGAGTDSLVKRLTNELSHLEEFIDRGAQPIDYAEIATLAKFVLGKMRENDKEQFEHFLLSIEQPDPFA